LLNESTIHIPGSKYIANRVIVLASLTEGKSIIHNVPDNQDINILIQALENIGIRIAVQNSHNKSRELVIWGMYSKESNIGKKRKIDVGESGTLLRFTVGLACLLDGVTTITAGLRNQKRPIKPLIAALQTLGARIQFNSTYPLCIHKGLTGGRVVIEGGTSSQFISSLLIVTPYSLKDSEIVVQKPVVSSHYINLTIREMQRFGVNVKSEDTEKTIVFRVKSGQKYLPVNTSLPKDWSSANYLLAESVILKKTIKIRNINTDTNLGESKFVHFLQQMGCTVAIKPDSISILHEQDIQLAGIEVDMKDSPDSVLTLVAVAVFARGQTVINNISHLIHKESDRINQAAAELKKIGVMITTTEDSITILGKQPLIQGVTETHNDHRLAMCLGLIKLVNKDMKIKNADCVVKSFPSFWENINQFNMTGVEWLEIH